MRRVTSLAIWGGEYCSLLRPCLGLSYWLSTNKESQMKFVSGRKRTNCTDLLTDREGLSTPCTPLWIPLRPASDNWTELWRLTIRTHTSRPTVKAIRSLRSAVQRNSVRGWAGEVWRGATRWAAPKRVNLHNYVASERGCVCVCGRSRTV